LNFPFSHFQLYQFCSCDTSGSIGHHRLTPRWSQRRLPLEFKNGLDYTTIIELAGHSPVGGGSALFR
jgi:hypothetical protein